MVRSIEDDPGRNHRRHPWIETNVVPEALTRSYRRKPICREQPAQKQQGSEAFLHGDGRAMVLQQESRFPEANFSDLTVSSRLPPGHCLLNILSKDARTLRTRTSIGRPLCVPGLQLQDGLGRCDFENGPWLVSGRMSRMVSSSAEHSASSHIVPDAETFQAFGAGSDIGHQDLSMYSVGRTPLMASGSGTWAVASC